ncbi:MAG: nucleotidyl transferase AbiEii/AbiGii toxin family protein [Deltaproteobacteria bacterium]|nr:nucleotidyl transferase AbiEii/AbiGii toxin family protein [Deltaproteobacteria bacterium]
MVDLVAELEAVSGSLHADGVEFALCGGLAVAVHGHVRATKDIDLLIPSASRDAALGALAKVGYDVPALPMTFGAGTPTERRVQRVSKLADQGIVTVDLVFVEPAFREAWATRQTFERGEARLVVVSRDGLLAMKRLAGRTQDLADIEALEGGGGDV